MSLPLWFKAADSGDQDFIKKNIYQFAGQTDSQGNTALMRACMANQVELVPLLQQEMTQRNAQNRTALMLCVFSNKAELLIPQLLREARFHDSVGQTALMIAAERGNTVAARLLKDEEYGEKDDKGRTALMHAAAHRELSVVGELAPLEHGLEDINKMTALMFAAGGGFLAICEALVQFECGMKNVKGETALQIAEFKHHSDVIRFLQEHEGDARASQYATLSNVDRKQLEDQLSAARERYQQMKHTELDNRHDEQFTKVSGDLLALNLRLQQAEVSIHQLRSSSVGSLTDSKLNIIDKRIQELEALIGSNHEVCYEMAQKSRASAQNMQCAQAELQAELEELKGEIKLLFQQLQLFKNKADGSTFEQRSLESTELLIKQHTELATKCDKIDMLEQLAHAQTETIAKLQQRVDYLERERVEERDFSGRSAPSTDQTEIQAIKTKLQENIDIMSQIISKQEGGNDDSIVAEVGKLKIDLLALEHEQYVAESAGLDGRMQIIEATVKALQEFVYGQFSRPFE